MLDVFILVKSEYEVGFSVYITVLAIKGLKLKNFKKNENFY